MSVGNSTTTRLPAARARSTELALVAAIQVGGAAMRFGFLVAMARVLAPASFADLAVALSWTQVIAAAVGGGAGAYLLTSIPALIAQGQNAEAAVRYRRTVNWSVTTATVIAVSVTAVVWLLGTAGATAAGMILLATAGLRAAVIATQESARSLGALAGSQLLTLVFQPALAVTLLACAALLLGTPLDALVATAALIASLGSAWVGLHKLTTRRLPTCVTTADGTPRGPVEWRSLVRLGAASAMFMWMVEGTLVLTSLVVTDKIDLARFAAYVRLSVVTSIAGVTVTTVASSQWSKRLLSGGPPPRLRSALRWSALGATAAAAAGGCLLLVAEQALRFLGESYQLSQAVMGGIVIKDVAVAAASPMFYFLVMRDHPKEAARAALTGAVALLLVPLGAATHGLSGAATGAATAGGVWLAAYVYQSVKVDGIDVRA